MLLWERTQGLDFNPFSSNNVLKLNAVKEYPQEFYFVLRTVLMFRGMAQVGYRGILIFLVVGDSCFGFPVAVVPHEGLAMPSARVHDLEFMSAGGEGKRVSSK